jgi:hypothetical protein
MPRVACLFLAVLLGCPALGLAKPRPLDRADRRDAREERRREAPAKAYDHEEKRERRSLADCAKGPSDGCSCLRGEPAKGTLLHGPACFPAFRGDVAPLSPELRAQVTGSSWHEGCPVALDDLALVSLTHWDLDGQLREGRLIVAARVADDVRDAFRRLYEARFPIQRVELVEAYGASDDRSMAANNTSSFNCRPVTGGTSFSRHAYGEAIDLNPLQNPYVRGRLVAPPEGRAWLDRKRLRPGVVVADGVAVEAFRAIGWGWGGRWRAYQDFQHFSSTGD